MKLGLLRSSILSPAGIYLSKVNKRNTRTMCEICSKLTLKTPGGRQWRRSGVFSVNFEQIYTLFWCCHCWFWTSKCRRGRKVSSCVNSASLWPLQINTHFFIRKCVSKTPKPYENTNKFRASNAWVATF